MNNQFEANQELITMINTNCLKIKTKKILLEIR